jgi:hypothetical protein
MYHFWGVAVSHSLRNPALQITRKGRPTIPCLRTGIAVNTTEFRDSHSGEDVDDVLGCNAKCTGLGSQISDERSEWREHKN